MEQKIFLESFKKKIGSNPSLYNTCIIEIFMYFLLECNKMKN